MGKIVFDLRSQSKNNIFEFFFIFSLLKISEDMPLLSLA